MTDGQILGTIDRTIGIHGSDKNLIDSINFCLHIFIHHQTPKEIITWIHVLDPWSTTEHWLMRMLHIRMTSIQNGSRKVLINYSVLKERFLQYGYLKASLSHSQTSQYAPHMCLLWNGNPWKVKTSPSSKHFEFINFKDVF